MTCYDFHSKRKILPSPSFALYYSYRTQAITARSMASGPMPYDDDKMPIYTLGVNIGMQISQQVCVHYIFCINRFVVPVGVLRTFTWK